MEEFPRELKRMQREQERERRRIRDRQRRQSMTQEQRERHLARRRRNYQLRRQRAANAQVPYSPFPQLQTLESSAGEASTSDELQGVTSSTFLDYGVLYQGLNQGQETFNFGTKVLEVYKPANSPRRMRLKHIKGLARNLIHSIDDDHAVTHQLAAELIAKEDQDVSVDNFGSTQKSLRLNGVKRLARSKNSPPKETADQKDLKLPSVGIQLLGNESFIGSTSLSERMENGGSTRVPRGSKFGS